MEKRHWSADDFLALLYGVGPEDTHIAVCSECRTRFEELLLRRERLRSREPELSAEFLSRQRRAIYERLEQKPLWLRLQPAHLLTALLLAFVILSIFRPAPLVQPTDTASDAGIFEDVFAIATSSEPAALEPARSLFEAQQ